MNVMPDGTTRFSTLDGKPIYKSIGCAAFSEYTVMPIESIVVVDKRAELEKICLIGCCVVTGYGNVVNVAKVDKGSDVAIFGLGAIGLAAAMAAKDCGAKRIIGVDINEDKFEIAKKFGCNEFVNPNKLPKDFKTVEQLFQSFGGLDYTFECIGNVKAMQSAFESLNRWGVCVVVGLSPKGLYILFMI
jgi:S-(hydroxymethyl)glutathione dehydrogenase/alcohol dehydrogenase